MADEQHFKNLQNDLKQAADFFTKLYIRLKLIYYFFERTVGSFFLKFYLKKYFPNDSFFYKVDKFLINEGGMFKYYVYGLCDNFKSLKNSYVLVPGVGYGKNLFQLAAYKPKLIIAFDLYEYPKEWEFLEKEIFELFGVEVLFLRGDFDVLPEKYKKSFDFIITDAVLEHVKNLPKFVENCRKFLKPEGYFYASFGPIWFGPGGDHIDWENEGLFNHLILPLEGYNKQFNSRFNIISEDSCEGAFMVREKLFSYLKAAEYFDILEKGGFEKIKLFAKISTKSLNLFKRKPELNNLLDSKNVPLFDRFCSGLYVWSRLIK